MMKLRYTKWVWVCTFMAMMSCQVERAVAQSTAGVRPKDNPFASVLRKQQYASTAGGGIQDEFDTGMPELSVATVKLQYVDAMTASEAFSVLCSEVGQIVPRESGNSLIVFDTPENIEKALHTVNPYAVDVSSGVEANGKKSKKKIDEMIVKVRNYHG